LSFSEYAAESSLLSGVLFGHVSKIVIKNASALLTIEFKDHLMRCIAVGGVQTLQAHRDYLVVGPFALQGAQISFGGLALPQQRQRVAEALIMRGVNAVAFVAGYPDHRHELILAFHLDQTDLPRDVVAASSLDVSLLVNQDKG